ncbi:AAWKG family protein [Streptomyces violaceorubidus]|uniref:AAWKG family protein n=1 Tax=Streptomyces violaceorubidus TaxID=284042 RepID=UPI0004BFD830|nr:AAWKG family protein [Streptomyces violaceorubidus]
MAINYDTDDYWAQVVGLYTGFSMPSRKTLFDKLKSKEGIPLMRVNLVEHKGRAVDSQDYAASSGWQASHGEDYRLAFYTHHGGDKVRLFTADIIFIGTLADANGKSHLTDGGATREGGKFTGKYKDEWDDGDLWRYVSAPKFVFDALVNTYKTTDFSYNGASISDEDSVDLISFERTAAAFDRAAQFFREQMNPLEDWYTSLGGEKAAWKGESADVVRTLFQTLYKNYDSYTEQMGGREYKSDLTMLDGYQPRSTYAAGLRQAQWDLHWEAREMQAAWLNWANSGEHDPHRALLEELEELTRWILTNNVPLVSVKVPHGHVTYSEANDGEEDLWDVSDDEGDTFGTFPGFSDNPGFGALDDINTWKHIGETAVARWNRNVEGYLVDAAKRSLSNLGKNWNTATADLGKEVADRNPNSLSQTFEKQEAKKAKDEALKSADDSKKAFENLNKNLSDANSGNKELFDNLSNGLKDANANQVQLNDGLNGLGDSFNDGLNNIGDSFQALNGGADGLGGGLNLNGGGSGLGGALNAGGGDTTLPLNGGLNNALNGGGGGLNDALNGGGGLNDALNGGGTHLTDPTSNSGVTLPLNPSLNGGALNGGSLTGGTKNGGTSPLGLNVPSTGAGPHLDADGNLVQTYPDGTKTSLNPDTGALVTTDPKGHTTTTQLNPGDVVKNPDGSHTRINADGTITTEYSDGTKTVFDPSDNTFQTTNPDGHTSTAHLNKPTDVPDVPGLGHNPSYNGGTTHLNGNSPAFTDGIRNDGGHFEYVDYDSTPFTGGRLDGNAGGYGVGGTHTSQPPAGGTPLNPGFGAGAGGAGGAAGAGGGGANGERVRTVLSDANNMAASRRGGSVMPGFEGEAMPYRQNGTPTTSTPMGGAPMGGGMQGGQSTESGERQRTNWVEEEEDVWGTEEGGTPAVIG